MLDREPLLHPVAIDALRPTQTMVGYREVARKRKEWRARAAKGGSDYLGQHMIPVVIGPKDRRWLVDNHHQTPFSESLWADFLRRKVGLDLVKEDFDRAVGKALKLARMVDAQYLPGWAGPHG